MSAESDVVAALDGAAAVTALVSTRIYADAIPEDVDIPAIVHQRTATEPITMLSGTTCGEIVTMSVQCLAKERTDAENVANAASAALLAAGMTLIGRTSGYSDVVDTSVVELALRHFP